MASNNRLLIFLFFLTAFTLHHGISQCQILGVNDVQFVFKNSKSFEDDVLKSAVAMTSAEQFSRSILIEDISKLKKFYFDNGFFDVQVDTLVRYNLKDNETYVKFIIYENKRFRIDSLIFNGLEKISPMAKKLFSKIKIIESKDFYNRKLIVKKTNEILNMLLDNGYMNARLRKDSGTIVRRYNYSPENILTVSVNFEGTDSVFYFGKTKIKIADNKYGVSPDLLHKQIEYKEGEIYSNEKKLKSEKDITKIPIVQSARIVADKINDDSSVDFIAVVALNNRHEIKPAIGGVTLENSFYLGGSVEYQNRYFLGKGRSLNLELNALYNSPDLNRFLLTAEITHPNLFNKKSALTDIITVGFYNREDAENYYLGNLTNLEYQFSKHTFFSNLLLSFTEEFVRYIYPDSLQDDFTVFNTVLSTTLVRDRTDNPFSPSRGFYSSFTIGSAGVLSRLLIEAFDPDWYYPQYIPVGIVNKYYLSLGSANSVLATKFIYYQNIEYGSGEKLVPVPSLYRYFSGGSNSLRGWRAKTNGILENTYEGGNFFLESSVELRQKISPRSKDFIRNVSIALFLDFGNVWETSQAFRWDQIAFSAGFGFRYDLAVGPIRFDIGYIIYDPSAPEENKWHLNNFAFVNQFAVHFAIGQAF